MIQEWKPPCGLKPRIDLAFEDVGDVDQMAELLDVTSQVMNSALFDDTFTPTAPDQATMWANLGNVAGISEHARHLGFSAGHEITIWESALWDVYQMAGINLDRNTVELRWVF